jgi:hypothetical protein
MPIYVRPIRSSILPDMIVADNGSHAFNGQGKLPANYTGVNGFTGDTGGTLDWQIGFEDPPYYGLLGSRMRKEKEARANAMREARAAMPPATNCAEATAGMANARAHIDEAQAKINSGPTPQVDARYLDAYNTILSEYQAFYNNNCLVNNSPTPVQTPPSGGAADPALQPAGAGAAAAGNTGIVPAGVAGAGGTVAAATKSVPTWAWLAGGGVVVLTAILLITSGKKTS